LHGHDLPDESLLKLDLIHTLAFAGCALFVGYAVRRAVRPLSRHNVPAPVVGGLLVAAAVTAARASGVQLFAFDTTLQSPLMIAFFTSIGFGASLSLLRVGGPQVLLFLFLATALALAQNLLGGAIAWALGLHPLLGVAAGSVSLAGGPATSLAFGPLLEQAGAPAAQTAAVASAMVGIVTAGIVGGPLATYIIERRRLREPRRDSTEIELPPASNIAEEQLGEPATAAPRGEDKESYALLKALVAILVAMWAGSWVSQLFAAWGVTLPAYIGAMLVAAVFRNLEELTGWVGLSQRVIDDLGNVALSLFIVVALMTLKLWEIAGLALPLLVILAAQVALVAGVCLWLVFRAMGRDYDAAVMSGGFCGFMLGTTANAMANMEALVEKYGPARRAFLVVPMVGAFFIDFTNAVLITAFANFWK
jgi:ESS family glutamate:Na+ symporter